MNKLNCIIIEDLIPAQRILSGYIEQVPNLNIAGVFINPLKAQVVLEDQQIDILFLDIHLPNITGIDFLKTIKPKPYVIFTTAFSEYALESYELDAVDYLLKPFSFERFLKSITKIKRVLGNKEILVHHTEIFIKTKGIIQKIKTDDILFIRSMGDFVLLITAKEKHIVSCSLKEISVKLGKNFLRCHKSFAVRLTGIDRIIGNRIKINEHEIPIGRTFKDSLLARLNLI